MSSGTYIPRHARKETLVDIVQTLEERVAQLKAEAVKLLDEGAQDSVTVGSWLSGELHKLADELGNAAE